MLFLKDCAEKFKKMGEMRLDGRKHTMCDYPKSENYLGGVGFLDFLFCITALLAFPINCVFKLKTFEGFFDT